MYGVVLKRRLFKTENDEDGFGGLGGLEDEDREAGDLTHEVGAFQ